MVKYIPKKKARTSQPSVSRSVEPRTLPSYHLDRAPYNSKGTIYLRVSEEGRAYRARMVEGEPVFERETPSLRELDALRRESRLASY